MQNEMFSEIPRGDRLQLLKDNCDSHSQETFMRDLTHDELDTKREQHIDNCIEISRLEEELKELKDRYKEKMNPLKDANKELLSQVKSRKEEKTGLLFSFNDQVSSTVTTYDEFGEFISTRRMRPDEKQGRLFVQRGGKTGTEE